MVGQVLAVVPGYYDESKCEVGDALLNRIEVDDASGEDLNK